MRLVALDAGEARQQLQGMRHKVLSSQTGHVTTHAFANGCVQHRWVNLRGVEEPLVLTREQVRDALEGRTVRSRVDDTVVVAVELVTNALQHTENGPIGMRMDVYEDTAMLWVHDGDENAEYVRSRVSASTSVLELLEGGRGLQVVAGLATRWLVWPTADGKAVVAEIDLSVGATSVPAPRSPEP